MTATVGVLIESKEAEAVQTAQFTATVTTIIDKFTGKNTTINTPEISVHLVPSGGLADATNLIVTKAFTSGEEYVFPELVGHTLAVGDFISAIADTANEITIRASGRLIT